MICSMCKKKEVNKNLKIGGLHICNLCYQKYLDGLDMQEKPFEYFKDTPFVACPECGSNQMGFSKVETAIYDYNDILDYTKGCGTLDDFLPKNKDILLEFKCKDCNVSNILRVKTQEGEGGVKIIWERVPN